MEQPQHVLCLTHCCLLPIVGFLPALISRLQQSPLAFACELVDGHLVLRRREHVDCHYILKRLAEEHGLLNLKVSVK